MHITVLDSAKDNAKFKNALPEKCSHYFISSVQHRTNARQPTGMIKNVECTKHHGCKLHTYVHIVHKKTIHNRIHTRNERESTKRTFFAIFCTSF